MVFSITNRNFEKGQFGDINTETCRFVISLKNSERWVSRLSPEKHEEKVFTTYLKALKEQNKNGLFVIHGFNESYTDALDLCDQLAEKFAVLPFLVSWPSAGKILNYERDHIEIDASKKAFEIAMFKTKSWTEKHAALFEGQTLNLLCHSLGNRLIKDFVEDRETDCLTDHFRNILLISADVPNEGHEKWLDKIKTQKGGRVIVTLNQDDYALASSSLIHRAGRLGNSLGNLASKVASYINLSPFAGISHSPFELNNPFLCQFFDRACKGIDPIEKEDRREENGAYNALSMAITREIPLEQDKAQTVGSNSESSIFGSCALM